MQRSRADSSFSQHGLNFCQTLASTVWVLEHMCRAREKCEINSSFSTSGIQKAIVIIVVIQTVKKLHDHKEQAASKRERGNCVAGLF